MTTKEREEMAREDDDLKAIFKDHWFGENEERHVVPAEDGFPHMNHDKFEEEEPEEVHFFDEKPIVNYDMPVELKQSFSYAIIPACIALVFWSFWMTGDASTKLLMYVGIPAIICAVLGAVAPWVGGRR